MIIGLVYRPPSPKTGSDKKLYQYIIEIANFFESAVFGDFHVLVTSCEGPLTSHTDHDLYNTFWSEQANKFTRGIIF